MTTSVEWRDPLAGRPNKVGYTRTWQIAAALLGAHGWSCSVDLLHSTHWQTACEIDSKTPGCSVASSGAGGEGGTAECGDGVREAGEECDGGPTGAVGCSDTCLIVCDGPGELVSPFVESCYLVGSTQLTWSAAVDECVAWGGSLASVTSSDEQAFVIGLVSDRTWIGGTDRDSEGQFTWVSGEPWAFAAWADEEPSNTLGEDCVEMNFTLNFAWNDAPCADVHDYLCERRPPGL